MNIWKYRLPLLLATLSTLCVAIVVLYQQEVIWFSWLMRAAIAQSISGEIPTTPTIVDQAPTIRISISKLISERYLYSLTREIETQLSTSIGTGVILDPQYSTFSDIRISGSDFIFIIGANQPIVIPMSSYLFDLWNMRTESAVSWEIWAESSNMAVAHPRMIALTFDDGPSEQYTNRLLDILQKESVHVTFFVLGRNADRYPQILVREHREWHEIGNHSYSHTLFTKISTGAIQDQLYRTDRAIYRAIWEYPSIFRPPYGTTNTGVLATLHMPAILWSIDSRDWQTHDVTHNIASIANAKDGDILIMHDIHESSIESVPEIIARLRARGFTFVTISELLSLSPNNRQDGKKCTKKGSCK